jgi:hypothetical protein
VLTSSNAQLSLGIRLLTDIQGDHILVTSPEGGFTATYTRSQDSRWLILESEWWVKQTPVRLAKLRARAWRLANDVASEFGWFKVA